MPETPDEITKRRAIQKFTDACERAANELRVADAIRRDLVNTGLLANEDAIPVIHRVFELGQLLTKVGDIETAPSTPIAAVIDRLLAEAPKLENPDGTRDESQAPAMMCHVLLRAQVQPLYGSLSPDPSGALRMLTPTKVQHPGDPVPRDILLEQFFEVEDVVAVMVEREVKLERSRIIGA